MAPSADQVTVRGTVALGLVHFLEGELSTSERAPVLGALPAPWGERFASGRLLASERVPLAVVNRLCALAAGAKREAVGPFSERAGCFGAREGLGSVFRPFFYVLSVANAVGIAPMMWKHIHDPGKLTVSVQGKSGEIRAVDYPGDAAGCARCSGWFRTIMELSGAKSVQMAHVACTATGAKDEVWTFTWE